MPDAQDKRVALVTGGAKRVGRAIVEKLAACGLAVAFTYNTSEAEAQDLAHQIDGLAIRADLMNPQAAVDQICKSLATFADHLDVLVNNASAYLPARLRETSPELILQLNAIHIESPLLLAQAFESTLRQSRGHIINMADLMTERPWPNYLAYCASKGGLVTLTRALARELGPEVTVNAIAPGVVEWPPDYPKSEQEKYLKRVPLNRPGSPDDVANLVHFLVTTGNYITGQIIPLDGGRSVT
jgi:pteridine reductase